jgi:uncharacterized RDD family membrane protein YckC
MNTPPPTPPNPYEAPRTDVAAPIAVGGLPLASPWIRLGAAIIDGLVLAPINYVLQMIFLKAPSAADLFEAAKKGPEAMEALMPSRGMAFVSQVLGLAVFIGVNFVFLKKGQTIGKMALKLQIQNRSTGGLLSLQDLIVKRVLPVYGVAALSGAFFYVTQGVYYALSLLLLVDFLLIFRPGRNTLHDDIANTAVVKLPG